MQTLQLLAEFGVPYSVDHIIGLPGEGAADQLDALRFYAEVQPKRIVTHWMTYFPGTTALDHARERGILDDADIDRILDGDVGPGYMFGGNKELPRSRRAAASVRACSTSCRSLPRGAIRVAARERRYRHLRGVGLMRQLGTLALAIRGSRRREHYDASHLCHDLCRHPWRVAPQAPPWLAGLTVPCLAAHPLHGPPSQSFACRIVMRGNLAPVIAIGAICGRRHPTRDLPVRRMVGQGRQRRTRPGLRTTARRPEGPAELVARSTRERTIRREDARGGPAVQR